MRKVSIFVALIFAAAAVASFASGSSETASTATANQKVTLNALFMKQASYSEQDVQNMTSDFEKANPNVTVTPEFVPYEALHDKIIT
ncbi:MAG TPA: hypothetical protein VMW69_10515, partial [Spirochaetia bacterium]|nr:hypothetical protein [Spirochaetia bacterium]